MMKHLFKHKNAPLILALVLPVLMIVVVALSIWVPQMLYHPKYNFLYSTETGYYSSGYYTVGNGKLIENSLPEYDIGQYERPRLYFYDVRTNKSTNISVSDAQSYTIIDSEESPDGFTVTSGYHDSGFFPFFGSWTSETQAYLVSDFSTQKVTITEDSRRSYAQIHFIGWIK